MKTYKGMEV